MTAQPTTDIRNISWRKYTYVMSQSSQPTPGRAVSAVKTFFFFLHWMTTSSQSSLDGSFESLIFYVHLQLCVELTTTVTTLLVSDTTLSGIFKAFGSPQIFTDERRDMSRSYQKPPDLVLAF